MNKMIKLSLYLLIFTAFLPLLGGGTVSLPEKEETVSLPPKGEEAVITEEQFTRCKTFFSETSELRKFIDEFEAWSPEDKAQIEIQGFSFSIKGKTSHDESYEGSLGYWIDCRTHMQNQRVALVTSLRYLQQQS